MFDLSLVELAVILLVVVLVIGPNELPVLLRTIGRVLNKIREFSEQLKSQLALFDENGEMEKLRTELQERVTYIKGDDGNLYPSYDITDVVDTTCYADTSSDNSSSNKSDSAVVDVEFAADEKDDSLPDYSIKNSRGV